VGDVDAGCFGRARVWIGDHVAPTNRDVLLRARHVPRQALPIPVVVAAAVLVRELAKEVLVAGQIDAALPFLTIAIPIAIAIPISISISIAVAVAVAISVSVSVSISVAIPVSVAVAVAISVSIALRLIGLGFVVVIGDPVLPIVGLVGAGLHAAGQQQRAHENRN
jgi:hypothetical protein